VIHFTNFYLFKCTILNRKFVINVFTATFDQSRYKKVLTTNCIFVISLSFFFFFLMHFVILWYMYRAMDHLVCPE